MRIYNPEEERDVKLRLIDSDDGLGPHISVSKIGFETARVSFTVEELIALRKWINRALKAARNI